jgi:hypothetical protein
LRRELPADAEADAYIAAVEAADGQALEPGVKFAIKNFVLCCKQDGIWDAIKASCILAGARTLNGALVPLVGAAPTNVNFVSGDYNRKTGLVGNATTKSLNSNRADNADPQDSAHIFVHASTADNRFNSSTVYSYIGAANSSFTSRREATFLFTTGVFCNRGSSINLTVSSPSGGVGTSRSSSSNIQIRVNGSTQSATSSSVAASAQQILVFARGESNTAQLRTRARLAFYSIGESLDLALLDARVTDLINAFGAAIP